MAHDQRSAQQLRVSMDGHLNNAWRIQSNGTPRGVNERFAGVSNKRILKLRCYQLFALLIENQV